MADVDECGVEGTEVTEVSEAEWWIEAQDVAWRGYAAWLGVDINDAKREAAFRAGMATAHTMLMDRLSRKIVG